MNDETMLDQNEVNDEKQNKASENVNEKLGSPEAKASGEKKKGWSKAGKVGAAAALGAAILTPLAVFPDAPIDGNENEIGDIGLDDSNLEDSQEFVGSSSDMHFEGHTMEVSHSVDDSMSFSQAFAAARHDVGAGGLFVWHGHTFGTYYGNEWNAMSPEEKDQYWADVNHTTSGINEEIAQNDEGTDVNADPASVSEPGEATDEHLSDSQDNNSSEEGQDEALATAEPDDNGLATAEPVELDDDDLASVDPVELDDDDLATVEPVELDDDLATVEPVELDDDDLAPADPVELDDDDLATVEPVELDDDDLATVEPIELDDDGLATVEPIELDDDGLATVEPVELGDDDLVAVEPFELDDDGLAAVEPFESDEDLDFDIDEPIVTEPTDDDSFGSVDLEEGDMDLGSDDFLIPDEVDMLDDALATDNPDIDNFASIGLDPDIPIDNDMDMGEFV